MILVIFIVVAQYGHQGRDHDVRHRRGDLPEPVAQHQDRGARLNIKKASNINMHIHIAIHIYINK